MKNVIAAVPMCILLQTQMAAVFLNGWITSCRIKLRPASVAKEPRSRFVLKYGLRCNYLPKAYWLSWPQVADVS